MLHSLLLLLVIAICSSAPADLGDSPFGPLLSVHEAKSVLREYKNKILKETTPADTIIFVGGSASYFYYMFGEADKRNCHLVPISGSRYNEVALGNSKIIEAIYAVETTSTLEERTKGFCESFIDPLPPFSQETMHKGPLSKLGNFLMRKKPKERVVLVDYSLSGASVNGFLRVIKSCVAKTYNPYTVDQHVNLSQPVVFLNVLGDKHLGLKSKFWDQRNEFGISELKDIVFPSEVAEKVVYILGLAEYFGVPRLLPQYPEEDWKLTKKDAEKFVHDFQQDPEVQELISMLKEIGKS